MLTLAPTFEGRRAVPSPEVTRLMLRLLALGPKDKVLEIGTGSGYQTAELAKTGAEVHSIELEPWLDAVNLDGTTNIYLHAGDGAVGIAEQAPFTAIMATCGVRHIPKAWEEQLAEGGLLLAPVGDEACQRLTLLCKHMGHLVPVRIAAYVRFQMMQSKPPVKELKPQYATH